MVRVFLLVLGQLNLLSIEHMGLILIQIMKYGMNNHYSKLTDEQQRMKYIQGNVLHEQDFKSDVTVAFIFLTLLQETKRTS